MEALTTPTTLTRARLRALLGPVAAPGALDSDVHEPAVCDGYVRRLISYNTPSGRASAFVCIPDSLSAPAPVVFCHHHHHRHRPRDKPAGG